MRIAVIGQSSFGAQVYRLLRKNGHEVVGVFTIPDIQGKADPLAQAAEADGIRVFKYPRWQQKKEGIPEVLQEYKTTKPDLNVLPFCSQFIPVDVIKYPKYESIIYHPSILPKHRGASAINWTLMNGDVKAGFSIFWADDGLDTGPLLLQKENYVLANDTVDSIYNRFLYPEGIKAMGEAVEMIMEGTAPKIPQHTVGASYDKMLRKPIVQINWDQTAYELHNFIRGNDKVPGAWTINQNGEQVTLFGSSLHIGELPRGIEVRIPGMFKQAIVHLGGMILFGNDGKALNVKQLQIEDGRMINACDYGTRATEEKLFFTDEEKNIEEKIKSIWGGILGCDDVANGMDFFKSGAGSMDVTILIEEVKDNFNFTLISEDVYMAPVFEDFMQTVIRVSRGCGTQQFEYDAVKIHVNNIDVTFPNQLFINNQFRDASNKATFDTINPTDESVICKVAKGTVEDVDDAVQAAKHAFEFGPWGRMNARDRGTLMYRLADMMGHHKEELATLETMDSGAVYTLALKTHIGMSIDTFRYFAGWCDKIHGKTIPINHARPNKNLTYVKREPIGVCGIVTPWNYPLMMLAWKMAACIAAGNTVVLKPAEVTSLTSLKFGELVVKAGFPPGVINIVSGSGSVVGQAIADHPDIRKIGFTGSTPVGKVIMGSCAKSNLKRCSLELGGKSPLIIFHDCDMEMAVKMGCSSVFFNKGENCIAAGRLFVEETIHDEYVERVLAEVKKIKIGNPLDRSTSHGPQNHRAHLRSLLDFVKTGLGEGASLIHGGRQVNRPGLFLEPTVFINVEDHMFIAKEESFGPIMIISKFAHGDVDGVIKRANATEYGLAAGVFTNDITRALDLADRLESGTVFVNTYNKTDVASPFGGFKQSGFGKDLGEEALNEYLKSKAVIIEY